MNMNIAIDATALYGRYNGVEYALWNLLCGLNAVESERAREDKQAERNRYVVYVPRDGPSSEQRREFDARWRWVRLPFRGAEKLRRVWWQQTQLTLQLKRDKCDLLHAPTYVSPLRAGVPVVLTIYDLIALSHPQFATPLNRLHYGALMKASIGGARRVIVPSGLVQSEVARIVPKAASKTRVVPLGVEPLFFASHDKKTRDEVRARYGLPPRFLLFVGNFEPKKNLSRLLEALQLVPDAPPLILAGGARAWNAFAGRKPNGHMASGASSFAKEGEHERNENARREDVLKVGSQSGSTPARSSRVQAIGYVRRRDLPVLYALCEAFVFPSLAEGFGLPVLEALASGAPVVTSTHVPLPDLHEAALLCDPLDTASIAREIRHVLQPDQRAALHRRGPEYARSFTWRRAAQMTLDIYREAATLRPATR